MILNSIEQGAGPPLILLHGLFGAAKNLGQIARGLSLQARVISLDLRNHGASPHDPRMNYTIMAGDVAETMAHLGVAKALIVGHSMGGKTAMALALTRPALVEKLAVLDIAPVSYNHAYDDYAAAMLALKLESELTRAQADKALEHAIPEPPMRGFLLNNLSLGETPHWRVGLLEISRAMPSLTAWADPPASNPYPGPALFLRGGDSDYVQPTAHETILEKFPHAQFASIDHAGHWLHADQPQAVIAALREFLFT